MINFRFPKLSLILVSIAVGLVMVTGRISADPLLSISNFESKFFVAKEGKLSYFQAGQGKINFILLPGIGDLKENYLPLGGILANEGVVYSFDLRGQGASDTSFSSYGPKETALDILEFIEIHKLENTYIIANSMTAASAVYIQSKNPQAVKGMILSGPFVRDGEGLSFFMKSLLQVLFRGPWGPSVWSDYYLSLYPEIKPEGIEAHSLKIKQNLGESKRMEILREMLFASKEECERALDLVQNNVTIIMGGKDPDFKDPESEAKWIAEKTKGKYIMFEKSGHYPYRDDPIRFFNEVKILWQKK